MAKTYNTIGLVSAGDPLTETIWNEQATNVNNYRVPPACEVRLTSTVNPYTVGTAIAWNDAAYDTEGPSDPMWASGANASRITIRTAGLYTVSFKGSMTITSGSTFLTVAPQISVNGTNLIQSYQKPIVSGAGLFQVSAILNLAASDYLQFNVENEGGATFSLSGNATNGRGVCRAQAVWIGQAS
jgi:hypothetical protein